MEKSGRILNLSTERGFTLVETMFVMLLFPLLFFSAYSVLTMANLIFNTNDIFSRLNQSAMQTLRFVSREIGQTSPNTSPSHLNISTDASNNSVVRFQIPVDWDNDGDAVSGSSNPVTEWGAYDMAGQTQDGKLNDWVRYSVSNNQLIREVLDAGLTPIQGLSTVVANNAQTFTLTQNQNVVTLNMTLKASDQIGQSGKKRDFQSSFSTTTVLRNAVN